MIKNLKALLGLVFYFLKMLLTKNSACPLTQTGFGSGRNTCKNALDFTCVSYKFGAKIWCFGFSEVFTASDKI